MVKKREWIPLLLISFLLLTSIYFLFYYTGNLVLREMEEGYVLDQFIHEGVEDELQYRPIRPGEEGVYTFTTTVYREDLEELAERNPRLLIYRLAGQWYRLFWNDVLIGTMGNLEDDRSNIWNGFASFDVDRNIIDQENHITLEVYATYELGLLAFPPILTSTKGANQLSSWFYLILNRLHHVALGFMFSAFLLLLFIQALSRRIQGEYLFYSLSAFFMSIASLDYLVFHQISLGLFTFKRLVLFCLYLSVVSISLGIGFQYKRKKNLILGVVAIIGILLLILFSPDLHTFRQGFSLLNVMILLNILGWIYTSYTFFGVDNKARILFFSSTILFLLSVYDIYSVFTGGYSLFSLTILGSLLFSIIIILLVVFYYLELQKKIAYETQRAAIMYQKSVKDAMTGVYNHQYLMSTLKEYVGLYTLLLLDIDDFKDINDTYGHQAGDMVIKTVAQRALSTIRKTDILGRYGGDEFLVILFDCEEKNGFKIAKTLKEAIEEPITLSSGISLSISLSIGLHTRGDEEGDEVLKKADEALYHTKRIGKGRIVVFSSLSGDEKESEETNEEVNEEEKEGDKNEDTGVHP